MAVRLCSDVGKEGCCPGKLERSLFLSSDFKVAVLKFEERRFHPLSCQLGPKEAPPESRI